MSARRLASLVFGACALLAACDRPPSVRTPPPLSPPSPPSPPSLPAAIGAAPAPWGAESKVDLPSGGRVGFRYDFDRNALAAMKVAGEAVVALTASGNLLRFDRSTLELGAERTGPGLVRCLGSGPGGVILAGLEVGTLGRVVRVDPATLELTPLAELDAPPVWVGADERGSMAVVERMAWHQGRDVFGHDSRWLEATHDVVDVASQSRFTLPQIGTTFLLDRKHRLWVGADRGEFGSWVAVLDVARRRLREPAGEVEGVYGFFERGDEIFAFGGLAHHSSRSFVARCTEAKVTSVARFAGKVFEGADPSRPQAPISRLAAGGAGGELLALSGDSLWRVDASFARWTKWRDVGLRNHSGRPDALSSYPAVSDWHRDEGGRLLLATRRDGLVRFAGGATERGARPGQLEAREIRDVVASPRGPLLLGRGAAWWRAGDRWRTLPDLPPGTPRVPNGWGQEGPVSDLASSVVHVEPDGALLTVARLPEGAPDGTAIFAQNRLVVTRWRGDEATVLWDQTDGEVGGYRSFVTPDGALWARGDKRLFRFEAGAWKPIAPPPPLGGSIKVVGGGAGLWILLDMAHGELFRLDAARGALERIAVADQAGALPVEDALPWANDALLIATWRGLYELPSGGGPLLASPLAAPRDVRRLARDARGRLWLGGEGLWVHDLKRGRLHVLDAAPVVGGRTVFAIAPDREGGVTVAFGKGERPVGGVSVGRFTLADRAAEGRASAAAP